MKWWEVDEGKSNSDTKKEGTKERWKVVAAKNNMKLEIRLCV
jgi:hypothetical protein